MTKTANAIDFFKKMSFHAKDKIKKFMIRPKTPASMLIIASLNLSKLQIVANTNPQTIVAKTIKLIIFLFSSILRANLQTIE